MAMICHTEYAAQKKAQIENGLLQLMMSGQYRDISVTDICRETGIPRRTFYHYFENKEEALDSTIDALMRQCFLNVMIDFRRGPEHIRDGYLRVFRFWEGENRKRLDAVMQSGLESRLLAWSSQWIRDEQMDMFLSNGLEPKLAEIILMISTTGFFALLFHWSRGGYQESPEEMAEYAVQALPQAILNM